METDEELLARASKDAAAFEPLVERHSTTLYGYLARRAPAAADDLLSEVWLGAYASRGTFDAARGTARAWLFGVARNVLSAHWRQQARGEPAPVGEAAPHDPWQAVDQRLDAAAMAPLISRTLRDLPHAERELLLLVAWEQLTPAEAAAVVGIPMGTARSRLHRARTKLRKAVEHGQPPSPSDPGRPGVLYREPQPLAGDMA